MAPVPITIEERMPMLEYSETPSSPDESTTADDRGSSYRELLGHQTWEVDAPESSPESVGEATTSETAAPSVPPSPLRIVEALLFVGGPPLTAARACDTV